MKYVFTIILMLLLSASIGAANISATKNDVEFCYQVAKNNSLDLKIERNADIELPLSEIEKYTICEDKWHPQIDLDEVYEVAFPKEWNCTTLEPLWYIKTCEELQNFFRNKEKTTLPKNVSHNCKISEERIDGRELKGRFILEIRKKPMRSAGETHSYKFTKIFNVKISGRCSDKTFNSKKDKE